MRRGLKGYWTKLPKKKRKPGPGAPTKEDNIRYAVEIEGFIEDILEINSRLNIQVSGRGWAYLLESAGKITKGEFGAAEGLITNLRKEGRLPINIVIQDNDRTFTSFDDGNWERTPYEFAKGEFNIFKDAREDFQGSWKKYDRDEYWDYWKHQDNFVMMLVEKGDLKRLFASVCNKYHIPIASTKGWYDLHQRWDAAQRFKEHEEAGRQPVLLYCGDHDIDGLMISKKIKDNFRNMMNCWAEDRDGEVIEGWNPENLIVDRFGLNADFIEGVGLTWLDNLETGGGSYYAEVVNGEIVQGKSKEGKKWKPHPSFYHAHVQEYLAKFGVRKCEANALVVNPQKGRELAYDSINKYVSLEGIKEYEEEKVKGMKEAKEHIEDMLEKHDNEEL